MTKPNLLAICGSLRKHSINKKLLDEAVHLFGNAQVNYGDLRMPLYDGDLEDSNGVPTEAVLLTKQIAQADAIIIACPEYNQGIPGVVKNALDWVSRTDSKPWDQKPLAQINAAAGRTGGARANYAFRLAIAPFNTRLLQGPEILIGGAAKEFDAAGKLANSRYLENLKDLMTALRLMI